MGKETAQHPADGWDTKDKQENDQDHPQVRFSNALFNHQQKMDGCKEVDPINQPVEAFPVPAKFLWPGWKRGNGKRHKKQPGDQTDHGIRFG